jgi:hypothetical protein
MLVEMRPITSIRPYENNPRQNDAAVDAVAASLQAFGWRQPIVVDEEGVIIVGHTRYKAALKLGWTEAPVHVAVEALGRMPASAHSSWKRAFGRAPPPRNTGASGLGVSGRMLLRCACTT